MSAHCTDCGGTGAVPAGGWEPDADNGHVPCPTCYTTEAEVRAVAAEFPTPQVLRAVELAEEGTVTWAGVHEIFRQALGEAVRVVTAEATS